MAVDAEQVTACLDECKQHLTTELLSFWLDRCKDDENGGFITHFDKDGNDTGEDEKSLIAQSRTVYTMASAHRAGYGDGKCAGYAKHGGFFWTVDSKGNVAIDKKIIYGFSFAIYSLSEYILATDEPSGLEYAEKLFDLMQKYCADTMYGGYFEMFERNWDLCGPGSGGSPGMNL